MYYALHMHTSPDTRFKFRGLGTWVLIDVTLMFGVPPRTHCNKNYTGPDGVECTVCDAGGFKDTNG